VFAELIFETGSKSVGEYKDEEEVLAAVKAHHERARGGDAGGPTGHPAERVVRVELYDQHPGDLNELQTMSTDVAKKELEAAMKDLDEGGAISVTELAARIRNLSSPLVDEPGRHDSAYRMEAKKVLTEGWE